MMKLSVLPVMGAVIAILALDPAQGLGQIQPGTGKTNGRTTPTPAAAEQALTQALAGPDGEYAAYAQYAAIIEKFGEVQPYAMILRCEERHINALQRHFELRGLTVPENPYLGKVQAPETLKAAAEAGITAEERNVALYDQLLAQVAGQKDLERVFSNLQWASREHHLPAFKAAAAKDGQLAPGQFGCGMGCGAGGGGGRGGPPPWAGGQGRGQGDGGAGCCMGCGAGQGGPPAWAGQRRGRNSTSVQGEPTTKPGRRYRFGQSRNQ